MNSNGRDFELGSNEVWPLGPQTIGRASAAMKGAVVRDPEHAAGGSALRHSAAASSRSTMLSSRGQLDFFGLPLIEAGLPAAYAPEASWPSWRVTQTMEVYRVRDGADHPTGPAVG
jgi:hypothetical protein